MQKKEPEQQTNSYFHFLTNLESRLGIVGLHTDPSDNEHQKSLELQLEKVILVLNRLNLLQDKLPTTAQKLPFFNSLQKNVEFLGQIIPALSNHDLNHSSLLSYASQLQPLPFTDYAQIYWVEQAFDKNSFSPELRKERVAKLAVALEIAKADDVNSLIDSIEILLNRKDQPTVTRNHLLHKIVFLGSAFVILVSILASCGPAISEEEAVLMRQEAENAQEPLTYFSAGFQFYFFNPGSNIEVGPITIIPFQANGKYEIINNDFPSETSENSMVKIGLEGDFIPIKNNEDENFTFLRILRVIPIYEPGTDSLQMMVMVEKIIGGSSSNDLNLPLAAKANKVIVREDGLIEEPPFNDGSKIIPINIQIPYDINIENNFYEETVEIFGRTLIFIFDDEYFKYQSNFPRVTIDGVDVSYLANDLLAFHGSNGEIVIINVITSTNYLFSSNITVYNP